MIVTILQTFVDAPKGRTEKRYSAGDIITMSKGDFDRITEQNKALLFDGKKFMGIGKCYPCQRNKNRNTKTKK